MDQGRSGRQNYRELKKAYIMNGGHDRNRTGIQGFAVLCVTIPPRGQTVSFISLIIKNCEQF